MTDDNQTLSWLSSGNVQIIKLQCWGPETNYQNGAGHYTSKTNNKQTDRKRDQICDYQRWGGDQMKIIKRYKLLIRR